MGQRHPLPYSFAKANTLLLEDDGEHATLWVGEAPNLSALSEVARLHRIDAVEIWHYYRGAPLELSIKPEGGELTHHVLGAAIEKGERPQIVVPRHGWQAARSLGDYTLVGCTVAHGFLFETFEMAPPEFEL